MAAAAMSGRRRVTLAEAMRSFGGDKLRAEMRGEWGSVVCYRLPSMLLTPLALNLGVSPTAVTGLSLLLVLALPGLALLDGAFGYLSVGLAGVAVAVLDCLDGNMARAAGLASRLGHYADFLVDVLFRLFGYLAVGLLIEAGAPAGGLAGHAGLIGLAAAAAAAVSRLSRVYVEAWPDAAEADAPPTKSGLAGLAEALFPFVSGLDPLWPLFVLLAGALGLLPWLLAWLAVYSVLDFCHTQASILARLR